MIFPVDKTNLFILLSRITSNFLSVLSPIFAGAYCSVYVNYQPSEIINSILFGFVFAFVFNSVFRIWSPLELMKNNKWE